MVKLCRHCEFYNLALSSAPCRHCWSEGVGLLNWVAAYKPPEVPKKSSAKDVSEKEIPVPNELQVLIAAIRTMQGQEYSLDWLERYNNLVNCLIIESGKQIGRRSNDK